MGACQSVPAESTVPGPSGSKTIDATAKTTAPTSPPGDVAASGVPQKGKINKVIRAESSGLSSSSGGGGAGVTLLKKDQQYFRNIDETDKTYNENSISDDPARISSDDSDDDGKRQNDDMNEPSIQVEFEVLPLKKDGSGKATPLHKRHSSCSSYDSWGGGKSIDSITALSELNFELKSSDDGLCTRVVRIEVRNSKKLGSVAWQ